MRNELIWDLGQSAMSSPRNVIGVAISAYYEGIQEGGEDIPEEVFGEISEDYLKMSQFLKKKSQRELAQLLEGWGYQVAEKQHCGKTQYIVGEHSSLQEKAWELMLQAITLTTGTSEYAMACMFGELDLYKITDTTHEKEISQPTIDVDGYTTVYNHGGKEYREVNVAGEYGNNSFWWALPAPFKQVEREKQEVQQLANPNTLKPTPDVKVNFRKVKFSSRDRHYSEAELKEMVKATLVLPPQKTVSNGYITATFAPKVVRKHGIGSYVPEDSHKGFTQGNSYLEFIAYLAIEWRQVGQVQQLKALPTVEEVVIVQEKAPMTTEEREQAIEMMLAEME